MVKILVYGTDSRYGGDINECRAYRWGISFLCGRIEGIYWKGIGDMYLKLN
jgi:hypothetical protein